MTPTRIKLLFLNFRTAGLVLTMDLNMSFQMLDWVWSPFICTYEKQSRPLLVYFFKF